MGGGIRTGFIWIRIRINGELLWSPNLTSRIHKLQINCSFAKQHLAFQEGLCSKYPGAYKYLDRPGRKQARKNVRDARDFNNIETRAVIKFFSRKARRRRKFTRHSDRNISLFLS